MQKIQKQDVERFFVTPTIVSQRRDIYQINPDQWDNGDNLESEADGWYWGQLGKAEAFGFPIDGGDASKLLKICTKDRAILVLYFLFTALELLVKKGLGLPRALLLMQWLYETDEQTAEMKGIIEGRFHSLGFRLLYESNLDSFFNRALRGTNWAVDYIRYHPEMYEEVFEKLSGRKSDDKKLAEKCDERVYLRDGWETEWVAISVRELACRLNISLVFAEGLLYLFCTKALKMHDKRCDHRKTKTQSQMLFAEFGCPLNQYSVPRFTEMLTQILAELDRRNSPSDYDVETRKLFIGGLRDASEDYED